MTSFGTDWLMKYFGVDIATTWLSTISKYIQIVLSIHVNTLGQSHFLGCMIRGVWQGYNFVWNEQRSSSSKAVAVGPEFPQKMTQFGNGML